MASKLIGYKSLKGQNVFITGATQGIGLQAAKVYAAMGANVVVACRNMQQGRSVVEQEIEPFRKQHSDTPGQQCFALQMDLSSLDSVRSGVEEYKKSISPHTPAIIVNNAGMMSKELKLTKDGHEVTTQVNFLSQALLTLELLKLGGDSTRVLHTSSGVYKSNKLNLEDPTYQKTKYDFWKCYSQSKLAQVVWSNYLSRAVGGSSKDLSWLSGRDVLSVAYDPGYIKTALVRNEHGFNDKDYEKLMGRATNTLDQGAEMLVFAGVDDQVISGQFLARGKEQKQPAYTLDPEVQEELWQFVKKSI